MVDDHPAKQLSSLCSVRTERVLDVTTVQVYGELDLTCEELLRAELECVLAEAPGTLVLDLRGLTFIDSAGLRMLIVLDGQATERGLQLAVLCIEGSVRRVLRETGLDGVLPVADHRTGIVPASDSPV
jgi:anti-sigma B factor antagonist